MAQFMTIATRCLALIALAIVSGCTHYEYDLTQPPDLARHVGSKADAVVPRDPLEYHLRSYENVLVMRVVNPTDDPIKLLGDQSTVVDPRGQSHPLRNQAIAPHSYVKLLFPPPPPEVYYHPGPTFGIGVGAVVSHSSCRTLNDPRDPIYGDPFFTGPPPPRYMLAYGGGDDAMYWEWNGLGEIRLTLVYQRGDQTWQDQFTFRRAKAK